jgi:hypothetical protein
MSNRNFSQRFVTPLLIKLEQEARKRIEAQSGQLLIIPGPIELKKAVTETFSGSVDIPQYHYDRAIALGRAEATRLEKAFSAKAPQRVASIRARLPKILPAAQIKNAFVVSTFRSSIDSVKAVMLQYFIDKKLLSKKQKAALAENIHKGHGVRGSAVSQVEIAGAIASIDNEEAKNFLLSKFDEYSKTASLENFAKKEIITLFSRAGQMVTPTGKLTAEYFSIVAFQLGKTNIGVDAAREKYIKQAFVSFVKDFTQQLPTMKGSSTLQDKIEKVLVDNIGKKSTKRIKVKNTKKSAKLKTTSKGSATSKAPKDKLVVKKGRASGAKKPTAKKGVSAAPLQMVARINAQISSTVAKNMGSPALNYRTGRFAESVRVLNVLQTPKGFPSFEYTYMLYPYQTFEPGYAQGSPERDPRKLIDRSIREIALQFAIGRFFTRRV